MVAITCMLVIANVQSSINEDIPKTSYVKVRVQVKKNTFVADADVKALTPFFFFC